MCGKVNTLLMCCWVFGVIQINSAQNVFGYETFITRGELSRILGPFSNFDITDTAHNNFEHTITAYHASKNCSSIGFLSHINLITFMNNLESVSGYVVDFENSAKLYPSNYNKQINEQSNEQSNEHDNPEKFKEEEKTKRSNFIIMMVAIIILAILVTVGLGYLTAFYIKTLRQRDTYRVSRDIEVSDYQRNTNSNTERLNRPAC